ncbi:MAG: acetyl-CoA carboxylase biotin carboxylase subunit family protein, partial [Paludibacteraceae bacterium]
EQMGLVGNPYDAAIRANNKYLMREAFIHAGVPCPKYVCVNACTFHPIHSFLSQHSLSFPLIVKPSDRSGSLGVIKVENKEELVSAVENACSCSFCHEAMIEEFVEGREISVEFISYKGQHYPLQITDKVTTDAPHFVELEHHQPSTLNKEMFGIIYNMTKTALNALGVANGASHAEYKITADGRIYIMEIGARMGGDFIGSDLVRLSTDYDFVRGVIEVALGEFNESAVLNINLTKSKYSGVYFLCEETKHLLPILEHANQYMEIVASELTDLQLRSVTCSADRSGYFIYQSNKKFII